MADAPTFRTPPVVEVALGVQFELLEGLGIPTMALYWETIRDRFPKWTQHPPLPSLVESFGRAAAAPIDVRFSLSSTPPIRSMFEDERGHHLIQLQHDRFVHNWRKHEDHRLVYPRYPAVRERFEAAFRGFVAFVGEAGLGDLVPNQCEVTYVNHIPANDVWTRHGQLGEVMAGYTGQHADAFLGEAEAVDLNLRYVIPDESGAPIGRLHVAARPVVRRVDGMPMFKLDLTARTHPRRGGGRCSACPGSGA